MTTPDTPPLPRDMSGLVMDDVYHAYEDNAVVRGVSLNVGAGEVACLLGPSGCGKTTLLRLAAGLETLQQGQISLACTVLADGTSGLQTPPEARRIGLMFQDYALFPHLTIIENVLFGIAPSNKERQTWARESLERIGLGHLADSYSHTLSGGQQQRVALLRALAPEPRVLLLDEPFSGMDVTLRASVREETLAILKETGVSACMVTHDPEEAMFMADRILIMNKGRIVQAGTPVETYFNPVNAFVANLFGPVNKLTGTVRSGQVETPLGRFPVADISDGTSVQIFIRPEGLLLTPAPDSPIPGARVGTILSARLLGRSSHVQVQCAQNENGMPAPIMQVRVPGVFQPPEGTSVAVGLDPDQVFIFPAE